MIATGADERDPRWGSDGGGFFYSSDRTGVFNVYYRDLRDGTDLMVTDVEGGAFQASGDGNDLLFAAFGRNGYEIRRLDDWRGSASAPDPLVYEWLLDERAAVIGGDKYESLDDSLKVQGNYRVTYTLPFIFPRVMVYDNKFRLGFAIDSRDFLDRQSVYAAADASFDGEFNLQIGAEFRQLKPTFNFDLLRMRKYWEIEDSSLGQVKYRYDLWDAYFTCKLEFEQETVRRRKDVSIRYNHGEYGVNINAWESIGIELGWNYYKADEIALMFDYRNIKKTLEYNINPQGGRSLHLEAAVVKAQLSSGDFEYSFKPLYNDNNFMRYIANYEEYIGLPFWAHSLTVFLRAGWIDREEIDDFFYLYMGGRDGLRGYSYYSIGGTKNAMGRLTYRFPIWRNIDQQIPGLFFRSLYGAVFAEAGKAWNENTFDVAINDPRSGAGYELRLSGFTFFSYPLAVTFMGAYGFDEIKFTDPFNTGLTYTEGRAWRYYGSVLFAF
jgi:outer membrane protein assembly factor BamA